MKLNVKNITDNDRLSPLGGEKLANKVIKLIQKKEQVILDFDGLGVHSSLFFNSFFGNLINKCGEDSLLKIEIINEVSLDSDTIEKCRKNAIRVHKDNKYRKALKEGVPSDD
ncbi:STAS-like domain-containing protein [Vagococcus lutrae]|uniref:STAS-like domain-containing protein n=1 Tax=Vagococcus lutrae TaxID=81947 RepID=UPI0028919C06|nr:STAS-like domain-containing protein [Vagococcus lutrae]MDT2816271.1 STAS-like domain-containing protein [Vagococcus lutrae]